MTNQRFAELFHGSPRKPEDQITEREINLASSIPAVTEEIVLKMASFAREQTGKKNLCLSGGVALIVWLMANCSQKIFENIWIQPASGDAGRERGSCFIFELSALKSGKEGKQARFNGWQLSWLSIYQL